MNNLQEKYNMWRKELEEVNASIEEYNNTKQGTWDCGEASSREDFSNYAGLEEEISFEDMLKLEENY